VRLAGLAAESGLDGVVCSALEASVVRQARGNTFFLVTPGIRMAGDDSADQRRVVTPSDALAMGADYLVIGRSITAAEDPLAALERVHHQLGFTP
ncbi:MAG: orotidine 5'-phosphate decarboxylase, partial [Halioglobus sp.]